MGQLEILEFLKTQDKPLSRGQIALALEYDEVKVSHLIKKLIDQNEVKYVEVDRNEARKILKDLSPVRRCKLYFV